MKDDTEVDYVPSRLMYTSKAQILYSSLVFGADRDKKISNWKQDNGTHFNQNKIHSRLNDWKPVQQSTDAVMKLILMMLSASITLCSLLWSSSPPISALRSRNFDWAGFTGGRIMGGCDGMGTSG